MLCVISPAKRLNEADGPAPLTQPQFQAEANRLAKLARGLSAKELSALMHISPALGDLNLQRFARFATAAARHHAAAFLFDGDTYAGLEARHLAPDALRWAEGHLRILSGLYGILRPMDAIAPYRLEMGSKLANPKGRDLYAFWGTKIARALRGQAKEMGTSVLINCASAEYFGAVDIRALGLNIVTPTFLEGEIGAQKIVSFWAKKARGAMARFICEHHLTDPADLRGFSYGGYAYDAAQSLPARPVFTRNLALAA